jgi:hypothetical protein
MFFWLFYGYSWYAASRALKEGFQLETAEIREVRIHIDEEPHHSPNPTTGAALYALGHVLAGLELYREVTGRSGR